MFMWTLLWNLPQTCWIHTISVDKKVSVKNKKKTNQPQMLMIYIHSRELLWELSCWTLCRLISQGARSTQQWDSGFPRGAAAGWDVCVVSLLPGLGNPNSIVVFTSSPQSQLHLPQMKTTMRLSRNGTPHFLKRLPAMVENSNHSNTAWI